MGRTKDMAHDHAIGATNTCFGDEEADISSRSLKDTMAVMKVCHTINIRLRE